jgi:hypothetical protein
MPLPPGSGIACSASYTAPSNGSVTATITAGSNTSDPNTANSVSPVTTLVVAAAAAPIPVNAWWSLVALMFLVLGGAAMVNRRHR